MSPVPVAAHDVSATRPARQARSAAPAATREHSGDARAQGDSTGAATVTRTTATRSASNARNTAATEQGPRRGLAANATDDEILEILAAPEQKPGTAKAASAKALEDQSAFDFDAPAEERASAEETSRADLGSAGEPANLRTVLDANPELRRAWQDANAYREAFATPDDARAATAQLADLDRMDALFFSHRPEDHAELARSIATLDPAAFASLVQAMAQLAPRTPAHGRQEGQHAVDARAESRFDSHAGLPAGRSGQDEQSRPLNENRENSEAQDSMQRNATGPSAAQSQFFQAANAEAVQGVLGAIESQVERLLPDGISKSARNRVVGEIYRELDSALQSNRQFGRQIREAFRSGALDADHQRAIVSLITGRARQTLPGVAKRVLGEWTSTVVAANHDRRARQRAAEGRVDIAGSGGAANEGRRSMAPRDIDYARMSDAEILNL
jgi:hypothetical protein